MPVRDPGGGWHIKVIKPRIPWGAHEPRAAEVGEALSEIMLTSEYSLEDAEYQKIIPNEFVVELHEMNYLRNYQPIEERVLQQWQAIMLEHLATANSRQGRSLYQLGAPLKLEIHPVEDLKPTQVRILCRVQNPDTAPSADDANAPLKNAPDTTTGCLETLMGEQRWYLRSDTITIGRAARCDIYLDMPDVQEKRLISSQHAHLQFEQGKHRIYDGSPDGRPSINGTFVNRQRVPAGGQTLQDGDTIILAALDPRDPRPDVPGVAALQYREECS